MTKEFLFLMAPEHAQTQDHFPSSDQRNISLSQIQSLLKAGTSYWGDGDSGGMLYFAQRIEGLICPITPELTVHHREGHGFQFFLSESENGGKSSIAINPSAKATITRVPLECQTPYFVPSNSFFTTSVAIRIVEEYVQLRGDIEKSEFPWLTVQDEEAEYENPEFWVNKVAEFVSRGGA